MSKRLEKTFKVAIQFYNLYSLKCVFRYEQVMYLLEKTNKGKNVALLKSEITRIVSESIKLKETLFKNDKFTAFLG